MTQASVSVRFYDCPFKSFEETISECDAPLYDWLLSITPARPSWTPQEVKRLAIYSDVLQQIVDDQAACVASRFAQQSTQEPGVTVFVSAQSNASGSSTGEADTTMRASVPVQVAPQAVGCPAIQYHILNKVSAVGNNRYNENTVLTTAVQAPAKNGINQFANTIIFAPAMQTFGWRDVIHQVFTGGNWTIHSDEVFNHHATWALIDNPTPGAELLARMEAFSLGNQNIALSNFPGMATPKWRVVHRYTHAESGVTFWFSDWMSQSNMSSSSWPAVVGNGQWGHGFNGVFFWSNFAAPSNAGIEPFDPEGTWTHETLVIDFAAIVSGQVKYHGDLCDEFITTFAEAGSLDPGSALPIASTAMFSETVQVSTIKQYKAAYRVTAIEIIDNVGVLLRVKLINQFNFAACIVARMPFGGGSMYGGKALSYTTIVVARNLSANTESPEISFVVPFVSLNTGTISYKMSDVVADAQNGGGIVEHGFACANNAYSDRIAITSITSKSNAIVATSDGQQADQWAFFSPSGARFWSQFGASGQPTTSEVFNFTPSYADSGIHHYTHMQRGISIIGLYSDDGVLWYMAQWNNGTWGPVGPLGVDNPALNTCLIYLEPAGVRARYGDIISVDPASGMVDADSTTRSIFTFWSGGNTAELAASFLNEFNSTIKAEIIQSILAWRSGVGYADVLVVNESFYMPALFAGRVGALAIDDYSGALPPASGTTGIKYSLGYRSPGSATCLIRDGQSASSPEFFV